MTGLIYVILIAMWGVVLVPRWLRHHDESRRRRETERMERALAPPAADWDAQNGRSASWGEYLRSLTHVDTSAWLGQIRAPKGRHARRRRTIVMALAGGFLVSLVGGVAGIVPGFATVLLGLLLAGYVSVLFVQMRQWEAQRRPAPRTTAAASADPARSWTPAETATDGVRLVGRQGVAGSAWDPRETTLPMYVTKPKASKIPRRIDLTREGWTGANMVQQAREQQASPQLQEQFDREFAALEPELEPQIRSYANPEQDDSGYYRRAVNE